MTATKIIDRTIPCFTIDDYEDIKIRLHEAEELIGHLTGIERAFKDDSLLIIAYTAMDKIKEADKNLEAVWIRWKKPIATAYHGEVQPDEPPAKPTPEIDFVAMRHGLNQLDKLQVSLDNEKNPSGEVSAIRADLYRIIETFEEAGLFAVKVKVEGKEGGAEHGKREG